MKKFLVALIVIMTLALAMGSVASAQTETEGAICDLAKQNDKVLDAKCVVWERTAIVAIKTERFSAKSAYKEFVNKLTDEITSQFQVDRVIVSRNPKVMKQVEAISQLEGTEREEAIKNLIREIVRVRPRIDLPKITFGN